MHQRPISFSGVLLITLLLSTLGSMALVTLLSFEVHEKSIEHVSQQVIQQSLFRVTDRLDELVRVTVEHKQLFARLAPDGVMTSDDFPKIFQQLWATVEPHHEISYFGVGIADTGEYAMLRRQPDQSLTVRMYIRDPVLGPQIRDYRPNVNGLELLETTPWTNNGDPRQTYLLKLRPFYQQAAQARQSLWTESYLFWDGINQGEVPGVTFATPVYDDNGRLSLIWDIDLELASLSDFLMRVQSQVTGHLLIVEHRNDGTWKPIAHPSNMGRGTWPTKVVEHFVSVLPTNYTEAAQLMESFPDMEVDGQSWRVTGSMMGGSNRPNWLVAEFWPTQQAPPAAMASRPSFLGAFAGAGILAALGAWGISRYMARPLQLLDEQARELSTGARQSMPIVEGPAEIVQLSVTLNQLADRIRERQSALEAVNTQLSISSERLQAHMQRTPMGAIEVDPRGCIQRWNPAAQEIFGWSEEEVRGRHFEFIVPEAIRPHIQGIFEMVCQQQGGSRNNNQNITKDGRTIDCEWFNTTLTDEQGYPFAIACLVNDVTERNQVETELRQLNEHLESRVRERTADMQGALRDLEAFSYSVAHDLRTPLRAISGFSHALEVDCGGTLNDECRSHLQRIRSAATRMGELIDALLRLSRIARHEVRRESVDLTHLVRQTFQRYQQADPERRVELQILGSGAVTGDRQLLQILIENLMDNAWKYTRKQPQAVIEFLSEARAEGRWFAIRDNGVGFDARFAEKALKPFERLHSLEDYGGHGIGLATASRIAQKHGGDLRLENRQEGGAVCWFRLNSSPISTETR